MSEDTYKVTVPASWAQTAGEPVARMWQARRALALASAICDAVPTRDPGHLGVLVNAQQDGTHGYRVIQDAEAALVAYLTTPEDVPPAAARVPLTLPDGWVPLTIEWETGYPEDAAFGPQRMMDRLKKWLDAHFAAKQAAYDARLGPGPSVEASVCSDCIGAIHALPTAPARTPMNKIPMDSARVLAAEWHSLFMAIEDARKAHAIRQTTKKDIEDAKEGKG